MNVTRSNFEQAFASFRDDLRSAVVCGLDEEMTGITFNGAATHLVTDSVQERYQV